MEKRNPKNTIPESFKPIYDAYRPFAIPAILSCLIVTIGMLLSKLGLEFTQLPIYGKILGFLIFFIIGFIGIAAVRTKAIPFILTFSIRGIPAIILGALFTGLCWWLAFNILIP